MERFIIFGINTKHKHMKKILLSSAFAFLSLTMFAQHEGHDHAQAAPATGAATATATANKTVVETLSLKESEHNFGKIPQGQPVPYAFEVSNSGKTDLKIDNVQASCGCTTPEWDREKAIAPGTSSKITVGFNAAAEGPFSKVITVTYNGTETKQLTIKGEVWKTPAASAPANEAVNGLKN